MAKVYVFLANGFEDVEALIPVDVLRRGGVEVVTVSTSDDLIVESAHGVGICADIMFEQARRSAPSVLLLLSYWLNSVSSTASRQRAIPVLNRC